ncbi:unnamed protein product [Oppiella nova]|uniref:Chitin-binding type-2 domain-containing protein n=1 Tax=Oppiella nova TaxID=334625 RepID=A0A7R9Q980_9ACAR|nr:unnamed protein product [Oppiella nova]CAG2160247.1 unnamed protein product [Oppiella nova]
MTNQIGVNVSNGYLTACLAVLKILFELQSQIGRPLMVQILLQKVLHLRHTRLMILLLNRYSLFTKSITKWALETIHTNHQSIKGNEAFVEEKGLKLFRWTKERDFRFPIRPPKLRKSNTTENAVQKARIGYASALQTRQIQTTSNSTSTPIRKLRKVKRKRLSTNNQTNIDTLELQSSDQSPSFAFFAPKRIASKSRITGQILVGTVSKPLNTTTRKRIPKLLLPKSLRPAMYSLDGFVPRPSLNRIITSTEAPNANRHMKFAQNRDNKLKHVNKIRRFGINRNAIEERNPDKRDDIDVSDSRRRNVVTKRKSVQSLTASDSIPKPTVNKLSKDRRIGIPGKDYPTLTSVPRTGFDCKDLNNGVYADVETGCQVWHICQNKYKHSFLCPNGTIFNEKNDYRKFAQLFIVYMLPIV